MKTKNICYPQNGCIEVMYNDDLFSGRRNTTALSNLSVSEFSFSIKLPKLDIDEVEIIFITKSQEIVDDCLHLGLIRVNTNFKKELEFGDIGPVEIYVKYALEPADYTTIELWPSKDSSKLYVKVDSFNE